MLYRGGCECLCGGLAGFSGAFGSFLQQCLRHGGKCLIDSVLFLRMLALVDMLITCLAFGAQEEEELRNNRLALLTSVANLPRGIADLSVLPGF